jgi:outer membrane biosynthesis protein TonB
MLTALLLGLMCAFAVACGESDEGLLSAGRAEGIQNNLDDLDRAVDRGDCDTAASQIEDLERQIAELPANTDRELRDRLQEGIDNLASIAPEECRGDQETQTETQTTETTPPPTTETTPPPTTETTPAPTTETTPPPETTPTTPPETVPPETTPVPPASPPGGEEAPSGAAGDEG